MTGKVSVFPQPGHLADPPALGLHLLAFDPLVFFVPVPVEIGRFYADRHVFFADIESGES